MLDVGIGIAFIMIVIFLTIMWIDVGYRFDDIEKKLDKLGKPWVIGEVDDDFYKKDVT